MINSANRTLACYSLRAPLSCYRTAQFSYPNILEGPGVSIIVYYDPHLLNFLTVREISDIPLCPSWWSVCDGDLGGLTRAAQW